MATSIVDAGEDCDPPGSPSCPNAGNGLEICSPTCTCACPSEITFEVDPNDPASLLDTGHTGFAHGAEIIGDGLVTVAVSGCDDGVGGADDRRDPACGVCDLTGPLANPLAGSGQIDSQRCSNSPAVSCTDDTPCFEQCVGGGNDGVACTVLSDCPGGVCRAAGTCEFFFGSMLPLSAGGVSTCVVNQIAATLTGTADLETGSTASSLSLTSSVFLTADVGKPCNNCIGDLTVNDGVADGTCDTGLRAGLACDVNGRHPQPGFNGVGSGDPNEYCTGVGVPAGCCTGAGTGACVNGTSLACAFTAGALVAALPIDLTNSTGTESLVLTTESPDCRLGSHNAAGFKCMCDTCNDPASTTCHTHADCPASGMCRGGTNAKEYCASLADCPDQGGGTSCGGHDCGADEDCPTGATCSGGECTSTTGQCGAPRCQGGANAGAGCAVGASCASGVCGTPGLPTAINGCNDATACMPTGTPERGECTLGPYDLLCTPTETFRACTFGGGECTFPGDTCGFLARPCFLDSSGAIGGAINAVGAPDAPINDAANPTLAATFCVGPTTAGAVNGAAGLPGPGRVTLFGDAQGLP